MKVLIIGNDPKIFEIGSESFARVMDYSGLFEEFHIISSAPKGIDSRKEGGTLFLWPSGSFFPFGWIQTLLLAHRIVRDREIDIVDCQDAGEHGLLGWLVSKLTNTALRLQIHTDILSPYYRQASWKERIRYWLAKFLTPQADCIRVVSERIKNSLNSKFQIPNSKIKVLPVFTDTSKFLDVPPSRVTQERFAGYEFKMVSVGRFVDKEKNFSMLLNIMSELVKDFPKTLLALVGDGPDKEDYKLQITNHKLGKNVVLEPWLDDLPSFLKSFDLFLLPSNYEGWGRVVVEAMASSLPVIMTDVGLAGEYLLNGGKNGIVVPVGDQVGFKRAISNFIQDRSRLNLYAVNAKFEAQRRIESKKNYLQKYKEAITSCGKH